MNCQTFSCGLSSGHFAGSGRIVMLGGTINRRDRCQPAWSSSKMACLAGATSVAISARCRFIASVLHAGRTSAAPLPSFGLVARRRRPRSTPRPTSRDLVLLADARLVAKPYFYIGWIDALVLRNFRHSGWEGFLK